MKNIHWARKLILVLIFNIQILTLWHADTSYLYMYFEHFNLYKWPIKFVEFTFCIGPQSYFVFMLNRVMFNCVSKTIISNFKTFTYMSAFISYLKRCWFPRTTSLWLMFRQMFKLGDPQTTFTGTFWRNLR